MKGEKTRTPNQAEGLNIKLITPKINLGANQPQVKPGAKYKINPAINLTTRTPNIKLGANQFSLPPLMTTCRGRQEPTAMPGANNIENGCGEGD